MLTIEGSLDIGGTLFQQQRKAFRLFTDFIRVCRIRTIIVRGTRREEDEGGGGGGEFQDPRV